ncbi:MAG: hypothetical protein LBL55_10210, partial [Propionibacteriaceae bacterium]|nr:hypothetical protein [Propionibacteriaceae bacterium]
DGTAAGDDNVTLGVRAGSADDKGTFQQMTGSYYGNQFRLRDGSVFLWGSSVRAATGTTETMGEKSDVLSKLGDIVNYIPQHVTLEHLNLSVPVVHIASTVNLVFLLDATGAVWMYGNRNSSPWYPNGSGVELAASSAGIVEPMRIDGGSANPGWKAGAIADIVGMGYTAAVRHKDGTVWLVGGNSNYMVRDYLDSRNTLKNTDQPLTQLYF